MKWIFYPLACLVLINSIVSTQKCELTNVKTVLWKPYDTEKVCWSRNDELLLYSRRVAQDLLPTKLPPTNLGQLLQYLDIVWEAASKLSPSVTSSSSSAAASRQRDVIKPAIGDAVGGYLQAVALPFATEAYYAGTVDYKTMKQFYDLFEKIRIYLDTDGGGWAAACDLSQMATKVEPIDYSSFPAQPDPFSCLKLHIPLKENPKVKDPDCPDDVDVQQALETKVEMPILDDLQFPRAIIVPFKSKQHLYSITSPNSAQILVEYYDLSMKCIGKSDQKTVKSFNTAYFNWLSSYILPHIQQLKTCPIEWYPGFGGAMRVVDTISRNGLTPSGDNRNYGIKPTPPKSDYDKLSPSLKPTPGKKSESSSSSIKDWLPSLPNIKRPTLPTINRHTLPTLRLYYFLMPLLVPLLGCLLLYVLYLLYMLCCLPLLACLCCRSRSTCKNDNRQPLLTLYYRCLESLNGLKSNPDEMPDYDSIAAASGVSARSLATSNKSEPKSCGMCQWIGTKEKTPETNTKKIVKKKKKKRKADTESEASN